MCCFINKQCYQCTRTKCSPKVILSTKKQGPIVHCEPFCVMKCEKYNIQKRRCPRDAFNSIPGKMCALCRPSLLTVTETQMYSDKCVIEMLGHIKKRNIDKFS